MSFTAVKRTKRKWIALSVSAIALMGLAGCGGGSTDPNTGQLPPPDPAPDPGPTLSELVQDPDNRFETESRALHLDWSADTASVTDQFAVSSIASDGDGGFHVVYIINGVEENIHFAQSDLNGAWEFSKRVDGRLYTLWSYNNRLEDSKYGIGNDFEYSSPLGSYVDLPSDIGGGGRTLFHYGRRTGSDMPEGSATYQGYVRADAYDNTLDTISSRVARTRLRGSMELTASFADATLDGRVFNLSMQAPGASSYEPLPRTTQLDITNGAISDDTFTATVAGTDSNTNTPLTQSVRGYTGDVSGRFYGPEGAEVGGVFTATRTEDDRVMLGFLTGKKERHIPTDSSSQFSALVDRDFVNTATSLSDATAMVETTGDGYRVTVTVGNTPHTFDLAEADFGAQPEISPNFTKAEISDTESKRVYFWREIGRFPGRPYFDYLDVNGVTLVFFTPGQPQTTESVTDVEWGYLVRGTRTAASDMPSGTATYSGHMKTKEWVGDSVSRTTAPEYYGDFGMSADFGSGVVTGTFENVGRRPGNSGNYNYDDYATTGLTLEGTVSGNELDMTVTTGSGEFGGYTGSAQGAFYGPQAAEVGGALTAENPTSNKVIHGWFAGSKE